MCPYLAFHLLYIFFTVNSFFFSLTCFSCNFLPTIHFSLSYQKTCNKSKHPNLKISSILLRKEVIHPHLPVRIPCYDFTPITYHTLGTSLLTVRPVTSGATNSRGVTGGVYKTRERIHRNIADLRLLVIPTS